MMTVLAEPCSPISRTALPCFAIVSMRKSVRTLSTFGTRILKYSGIESFGYTYSGTCIQLVHNTEVKSGMQQIYVLNGAIVVVVCEAKIFRRNWLSKLSSAVHVKTTKCDNYSDVLPLKAAQWTAFGA